jgi:starch synthase
MQRDGAATTLREVARVDSDAGVALRSIPDTQNTIRGGPFVKAVILTREYPPEVYGGAGVHVEYLARELVKLTPVEVRCFGADRDTAAAFRPPAELADANPALQTMAVDLLMAARFEQGSIAHSHTWYANFAGHVAKLLHGVPHVMTTHSLEPLRPWKAEQLAGGYELSSFCERTAIESADAVIAVSGAMRQDVLRAYPQVDPAKVHVILNGIDTGQYRPDPNTDVLERYGVDPSRPYVIFVGRVTRQKGIVHLLEAASRFDPSAQVVLAAGAPDTEEIAREMETKVAALQANRDGVIWIEKMLEKPEVIQLLTHASVFVCPSIYEPLGIVNLEAMACGTAVVATATGGIPEVVVDGETGLLVPFTDYDPITREPSNSIAFADEIARRVNFLLGDPELAARYGEAGRRRAVEQFSWSTIAEQTLDLYRAVTRASGPTVEALLRV